mmetsp:Transcript_27514/g.52364  ORF Transcript_27514/g.52364 Transcript_27514/m.52364 type:complete len:223 (-) Transcript_27514:46-714(-)
MQRLQHLIDVHLAFALDVYVPMQLCLHICVFQQPVGFLAEPDGAEAGVRAHARGGVDGVSEQTVEASLHARHRPHAAPRVQAHLEVQGEAALGQSVVFVFRAQLHHLLGHVHQRNSVLNSPLVGVGMLGGNAALHHRRCHQVVLPNVLQLEEVGIFQEQIKVNHDACKGGEEVVHVMMFHVLSYTCLVKTTKQYGHHGELLHDQASWVDFALELEPLGDVLL